MTAEFNELQAHGLPDRIAKVWAVERGTAMSLNLLSGGHDFRVRSAVAGNMTRKFVHVGHDYRFAFCCARAADALANLNSDARRLALERPKHQLAILHEIKSGPIHIRQRMKKQGREVRRVRDQIAFAGEQSR